MNRRWAGMALLPRMLVVAHDLAIVCAVWALLYWLAGQAGAPAPAALGTQLAIVLAIQAAVFWRVGLYRGVWRFASVPDLVNLASAAFIGLLLVVPVFLVLGMLPDIPRRVLVPYPLFLVLGLGAGSACDLAVPAGELIAYGPLLSDDGLAWLGTAALLRAVT